jgi:N-acetyl sugar amidotransferase
MAEKKLKVVVISADYPSPQNIYGDVFVHTRLKEYARYFDVEVVGYNAYIKAIRDYNYENIRAFVTPDLDQFKAELLDRKPDIIVGHLVQHQYLNFLLSTGKPLLIFFHGYETTSWRRRLMNYDSLGSLRYLAKYFMENRAQLGGMKAFLQKANGNPLINFVFVSNWLKQAAETDLGLTFQNARVIPNGIDTSLFRGEKKNREKRKNILILRSFKAINYSNDLSVQAIHLLSTKKFFTELKFIIYGTGYLFKELTDGLKQFPNVELNNFFVENKNVPAIHEPNGIFLCPSRLDTQGVSMCEAMASGLVPITSRFGGIPEYAQDGVNALYAKSAQEIADKIEFLYHNPSVFEKMSAAARQAIVDKCALKDVVQKEMLIIRSLCGEKTDISIAQQCTRCVLDVKDDPSITFDRNGVCSHCTNYDELERQFVKTGEEGDRQLAAVIQEIKNSSKGKQYDCIIGLSGGVDSTYLAWQCNKFGLNPLAVHFDNGWNSELAVKNIETIVTRLNIDLATYVIDWEEFRNLQLAFLKASVVDIEMITDHAIMATMYKLALKHKINYILSGTNIVTEAILPSNWIHPKDDHIHIRAINKQFGTLPLRKFPLFNSWTKIRVALRGIRKVSLLNYMPYNKAEVKKFLIDTLGWRDYGGKHYESVFTRFYQGYILPHKFGIDKRKAHLSNLICSGQITREEALAELKVPAYDPVVKKSDYEFVLKKLELSGEAFEEIMQQPVRLHSQYPVHKSIFSRYVFLKPLRPFWRQLPISE